MLNRDVPEKELEKLSRAITEAILNSKDVNKIINEIREKDLILHDTLMIMVLKLETLSKICNNSRENVDDLNKHLNKEKKKARRQLVDGKELNPNEIAFQEFLAQRFNDKEWLKKNGLVF